MLGDAGHASSIRVWREATTTEKRLVEALSRPEGPSRASQLFGRVFVRDVVPVQIGRAEPAGVLLSGGLEPLDLSVRKG